MYGYLGLDISDDEMLVFFMAVLLKLPNDSLLLLDLLFIIPDASYIIMCSMLGCKAQCKNMWGKNINCKRVLTIFKQLNLIKEYKIIIAPQPLLFNSNVIVFFFFFEKMKFHL